MPMKNDFSIDCMFIDFGAWKCQPRHWIFLQRNKLSFNEICAYHLETPLFGVPCSHFWDH